MKIIKRGRIDRQPFGFDQVDVVERTYGPAKGRFSIRGGGFRMSAHRATAEACARIVEAHAHFAGWDQ